MGRAGDKGLCRLRSRTDFQARTRVLEGFLVEKASSFCGTSIVELFTGVSMLEEGASELLPTHDIPRLRSLKNGDSAVMQPAVFIGKVAVRFIGSHFRFMHALPDSTDSRRNNPRKRYPIPPIELNHDNGTNNALTNTSRHSHSCSSRLISFNSSFNCASPAIRGIWPNNWGGNTNAFCSRHHFFSFIFFFPLPPKCVTPPPEMRTPV